MATTCNKFDVLTKETTDTQDKGDASQANKTQQGDKSTQEATNWATCIDDTRSNKR